METKNRVAGAIVTGLCGVVMMYGGLRGMGKINADNLKYYNTSIIEHLENTPIIEHLETMGRIAGNLVLQLGGLALAVGGPYYLLRRRDKNN